MRKPTLAYLAMLATLSLACSERSKDPVAVAVEGPRASVVVNPKHVPGRYIVVLNATPAELDLMAGEIAKNHQGKLGFKYSRALRGFSIELPIDKAAQIVALISKNPRVRYVEPVVEFEPSAVQLLAPWQLDRVDQRDRPLNTTYTYEATGLGVNVYVIDSGIRKTHLEFGGRVLHGTNTNPDKPASDSDDCHGHGTKVAGSIAGNTYGVAKQATLYAVRVLSCRGAGTSETVIAGIEWVTANHIKPAVANVSFRGDLTNAVNDAVTNSIAAGVTYVVAANNERYDACRFSPSSVRPALTVGSTDRNDREAETSNGGPCVDLLAPGVDITTASYASDVATTVASGTSQATAHVSGAAAMYLQTDPTASPAEVHAAIVDNATVGRITFYDLYGYKPAGTPNRLLYTGFLGAVSPPPETPPISAPDGNPTNLTATAAGTAQINLSWTDGSTNESAFEIYRCTGAGCASFVLIGSVPSNTTSFQNTGLASTTTYTYRVHATNLGGASENSNSASATTATPLDAPPVARYTWRCDGAGGRNCDFDGRSSTDDNAVTSYAWTFNNEGATSSSPAPSRRFSYKGNFSVRLEVTDVRGQKHSVTCSVGTGSSGRCSP